MHGCYIDHVAYVVNDVQADEITELARLLDWEEFQATSEYEAAYMRGQYNARWFKTPMGMADVHLVQRQDGARDTDPYRGLEHMCVMNVGEEAYGKCASSPLCARESGSGRLWLETCGLRVEVHA